MPGDSGDGPSHPCGCKAEIEALLIGWNHPVSSLRTRGGDAGQARAFCLLNSSTLPFLSLPESATLLNRGIPEAGDLLERLVNAGLLIPMGPEHYQVHSLARLFGEARSSAWRSRQESWPP